MIRHIFITVLFISISCCVNAAAYKIEGKVISTDDGGKVYLNKMENGEMKCIDSVAVKNHAFILKGKTERTELRYIIYKNNSISYHIELFLSNEHIKVELGENCNVSGTELNDSYQKAKNRIISMNKEMEGMFNRVKTDSSLSKSEKEALISQIKRSQIGEVLYIRDVTSANISNAMGVYFLGKYASAFEDDQIKELLAKVPQEYSDDEAIKELKNPKEVVTIENGEKYKDISMTDKDGNTTLLSQIISKNKFTLLDFWASWCAPCRREMPNVKALYGEYHDKGFEVVGFSLDDKNDKWIEALQQLNLPWPQFSDSKAWKSDAAQQYGVTAIPHTLLISQNGTIVGVDLRGNALKAKLEELMK